MPTFDAIIIGAGHNGLVCAAYLAKSGMKTLVVEGAQYPGGLAQTREFHPDFHASVAHTISHFSSKIIRDLRLQKHGYKKPNEFLPTIGMGENSEHVFISDEVTGCISDKDADNYKSYEKRMRRLAKALAPFWSETMPRVGNNNASELITFAKLGLKLRLLGKEDMHEFLRIASLPIRDLLDEHFESELLKASLSWDSLIGSKIAPRSPNSAVLTLLYRMAEQSRGRHIIPAGGSKQLIDSLCKAVTSAGAEVRCSTEVDKILVNGNREGLRTTGIRLTNGETISADHIISAVDPKQTFLHLVGVDYLDIGFTNRIGRLRSDGYVAKLHLALDGMPEFTGLDKAAGRLIIAPTMDSIEFAFDEAKYGNYTEHPVMEIVIPSIYNHSLAPDGKHVLSAHVMYMPHNLKGGWTTEAHAIATQNALKTITKYAPNIPDKILGYEFLSPTDLEREFHVTGGHWHHADIAMDQMLMMRPTYEAAQYRTPIPGLYLCGAGCHPGGDITGLAGHNAAQEILK